MRAAPVNIHAGLVTVGGLGLLVTGRAQSGKSALAVSLLRAAAREGLPAALVADDRVLLERVGDGLLGRAPASIAGLLELPGIGILRLATLPEAPVDLLVELAQSPERLPEQTHAERLGVRLRRVVLPERQAPFSADLLLTLIGSGKDSIVEA